MRGCRWLASAGRLRFQFVEDGKPGHCGDRRRDLCFRHPPDFPGVDELFAVAGEVDPPVERGSFEQPGEAGAIARAVHRRQQGAHHRVERHELVAHVGRRLRARGSVRPRQEDRLGLSPAVETSTGSDVKVRI